MTLNKDEANLEWLEMAAGNERELFYEACLKKQGELGWVVIVSNPVPFDGVRADIEKDCENLLVAHELPKCGLAWLCARQNLAAVLPGLFQARRPELVFLTFSTKPTQQEILQALEGETAHPEVQRFIFD